MFACLSASIEWPLRYENFYLLVKIIEHLLVKIIALKHGMVYKDWNIMIPSIDIEIKLKIRCSVWFNIAWFDFAVDSVKLL